MSVLLSIKPEFVEAIFSQRKKYEFRKSRPRFRGKGHKVYIYSSSPVCRIVAVFTIGSILENHPKVLWRRLRKLAGIDAAEFFGYFGSRKTGYAIEIASLQRLERPIEPKTVLDNFVPPQSFRYVPETWEGTLSREVASAFHLSGDPILYSSYVQ